MLDYYSKRIVIINSIGLASIITAVTLRAVSRKLSKTAFGADDLMLIIALILGIAICTLNIYAGAINAFDTTFPDIKGMQESHKFSYLELVFGHPAHGAGKAAVVMFCKRIFTTKDFVLASNIMLGVLFAWTVSGLVAHIFSAHPIDTWWTQFIPAYTFDWKSFFIFLLASNMVIDVIIWLLPISVIRRLQMSLRRKILLSSVFALGLLCIIFSALRLYWAVKLYKVLTFEIPLSNLGPSTAWSSIWGTVEGALVTVVACAPTFGSLFTHSSKSKRNSENIRRWSTLSSYSNTPRSDLTAAATQLRTDRYSLRSPGSQHSDHLHTTLCMTESTDTEPSRLSDSIIVEKSFGCHVEDITLA